MNYGAVGNIESQCVRKQQYPNKLAATVAMRKVSSTAKPYRCPHCDKWHIGTPHGAELKRVFFGLRRNRKRSR